MAERGPGAGLTCGDVPRLLQEILPQACFPGQPGPELETRFLPYSSQMTVEFAENGSDIALRSSDPEGVEKGYCKLQVAGFLSKQARSQTGLANWPECFMTYLLLLFLFGTQSQESWSHKCYTSHPAVGTHLQPVKAQL